MCLSDLDFHLQISSRDYSCRSASIGRSLEAFDAGSIQKNTQIHTTEMNAANTEFEVMIAIMNLLRIDTIRKLPAIPIAQAKRLMITDSVKN